MNTSLMTLDDLELELRKLPGVRAAGFDDRDDILIVQLHIAPGHGDTTLPVAATRIAARHSDRPVAVEIVRWRETPATSEATGVFTTGVSTNGATTPAGPAVEPTTTIDLTDSLGAVDGERAGRRPRLLAVLSFSDTDELEVHLIREGKRTIGRGPASGGLAAAVEATVEAVRELGISLAPGVRWARAVEGGAEGQVLVAVALDEVDGDTRYGMAAGASPIEAAAKAALDALNRRLELVPDTD